LQLGFMPMRLQAVFAYDPGPFLQAPWYKHSGEDHAAYSRRAISLMKPGLWSIVRTVPVEVEAE
jgi:hypothetical protein